MARYKTLTQELIDGAETFYRTIPLERQPSSFELMLSTVALLEQMPTVTVALKEAAHYGLSFARELLDMIEKQQVYMDDM